MTVAEVFVQCLANEGVEHVFGVPGEETEDLQFALESSPVKFIPTRHEQGAAFMADVWGRLTGKAGVCLATLGPGATNLVTGVADAFLDKSPLVAITGQAGQERLHQESHQFINVVELFRPITKWNASIIQPEVTSEIVRKAFKIAELEKPGATHIELPEDVAKMLCVEKPLKPVTVRRPAPNGKSIQVAAEFISRARHPLIIAGNGAIRKRASRQLRELSTAFNIPVVHTFMGRGAVSDECEESLFSIGLGTRDIVLDAVEEADLVITVGYDIAEYAPEKWNPKTNKKIVHIDFTPADVYTQYQPEVEVVADICNSIEELHSKLMEIGMSNIADWHLPIRQEISDDLNSYKLTNGEPLHVPGILNLLRELMAPEDLLISDVGSHKLWIGRNFRVLVPNSCIISNGLASMGIALPGAIAAWLQNPSRRIVSFMGDGGFMMNSQELETAKRLGAKFTTIVTNDNDYGLISWKQRTHRGRSTGTKLTNPNFKQYAESFGIRGFSPRSVEALKRDLATALNGSELSVIDIEVDPKVGDLLQKRLSERKPRE